MRIEWQGTRELAGRVVTNTIVVEVAGEADADAIRIRRYMADMKAALVDTEMRDADGGVRVDVHQRLGESSEGEE